MARPKRDPRTKEEILNRILSYDFNGDIRDLGAQPASITRTGPHTLRLTFPDSGTVFDVSVHRPREFAKVTKPKEPAVVQKTRRKKAEGENAPKRTTRRTPRENSNTEDERRAAAH